MYFMAVKKSRKRSSFVLYSYFNDSAFTEIKKVCIFLQQVCERGIIFNRRYTKSVLQWNLYSWDILGTMAKGPLDGSYAGIS